MRRIGHVDCQQNLDIKPPEVQLENMFTAIQKRKPITARKCHELLLAHGGFRPHCDDAFRQVAVDTMRDTTAVADLASFAIADPNFVIRNGVHKGLLCSWSYDMNQPQSAFSDVVGSKFDRELARVGWLCGLCWCAWHFPCRRRPDEC